MRCLRLMLESNVAGQDQFIDRGSKPLIMVTQMIKARQDMEIVVNGLTILIHLLNNQLNLQKILSSKCLPDLGNIII
jgi:hypothetical protein